MAEYQKCKHCIDGKKNEIEETLVFCEIWGEWKNVTLGDCFGNCESQEEVCDDRERLIKVLSHQFGKSFSVAVADWLIENDVVPVVRCKECKYYTEQKHRCDHPCQDWDVECYDQWLEMEPDDFCSQGERRTDEQTKI